MALQSKVVEVSNPGVQEVASYIELKGFPTAFAQEVVFETKFKEVPTVLVTLQREACGASVTSVPTITRVTCDGCQIVSSVPASTYKLNIVAATHTGLEDTVSTEVRGAADLATAVASGGRSTGANLFETGSVSKTGGDLQIRFKTNLKANHPVVLVSPFWNGSRVPVGYVETVDDTATEQCNVVSHNWALEDYFVNYLAADLGRARIDGRHVQVGSANKLAAGRLRVYFGTRYATAPVVILSPLWRGAKTEVRYLPTLSKVTPEYFEVSSDNYYSTYYVNWLAVST